MRGSGKYRAFISYSHVDKRIAIWLHKTLETYRLPRRLVGKQTEIGKVPAKLSPIFRDRDELPAAGALSVELRKALDESAFLIMIASRASAQSPWANEEVRYFKQIHGESRVLVLIIDGVPGAGDENECFPLALRKHVDEIGQITEQNCEPIAADLRPNGDGKRLVKLKLIAGLTGLPLDDLVQRDEVRRQRTLIGYATVTTLISISMAVLAVLAIRGQVEAEQQRAEADGLVEYMLTDLRMQLEPVGRLEIFDSVGKRALAYYANQKVDALDADSLGRRARALHLVGEVRELRADTQGALEAFEQAEQTTAELLERDPTNENRIFDHSQSAYWVGYVAWQRNELDSAEFWLRKYHQLATQLVKIKPSNEEWLVEESSALVNLGVLTLEAEKYSQATVFFQQALETDTRLANADPQNREKKWSMAQGHAWLSDAMKGAWNFSAAMQERQKELSIYSDILNIDKRDARAIEGMAVAQIEIADLNILAGQYVLALRSSELGMRAMQDLLKNDPSNSLWQDVAVSAINRHVESLMLLGKWQKAKEYNQLALQQAQQLVQADPSVLYRNIKTQMSTLWMEIAIAFALNQQQIAREKLIRFHEDFSIIVQIPKKSALKEWFMIYAMDILDKSAQGQHPSALSLINTLRDFQPNQPRQISVLHYLEENSINAKWPAHRVAQSQNVGYNPALILNAKKELNDDN